MQIDEKIVLNEFAIEFLVCNTLNVSERIMFNSNTMSNVITLLSSEAVLDSNKTNGEKIPEMSLKLKDFIERSLTIEIDNDSIFVALIYASHSNLDYAKLISYYVQYKCMQEEVQKVDIVFLLGKILKYQTWHPSLLKQIWYSQKINNTTMLSEDLIDYVSASGSIQFKC